MENLGKRILVVNAKGGCGKTTIATNLAAYFSSRFSTALIDHDPQCSSVRWLTRRDDEMPPIHNQRSGDEAYRPNVTRAWMLQNPQFERTIIDAPAGIGGQELVKLVRQVDTILVPVQPSPIDIHATADFIRDLLLEGQIRARNVRVGIIANRVKANTKVYRSLKRFLKTLGLPFIASLRDTQNYMKAAEEGIGIHELPPSQARQDAQQWIPLIHWLEHGSVLEANASIAEQIPSPLAHAMPVADAYKAVKDWTH